MNKLSLFFRSLSFSLVIALITNSMVFSKAPSTPYAVTNCGEWKIESTNSSSSQGIGVTLLQQASGSDCSGMFILENRTGTLAGRGYSLTLKKSSSSTNIQFLPSGDPVLVPGLNMVIKVTPIDISKLENDNLQGEITFGSFLAVDLSNFVLKSIMDLMPLPPGCLVPNDQVLLISLRASPILENTARSAFEGDLIGSKIELSRVINVFYEKVENLARDVGIGCLADSLKTRLGIPDVTSKIILSYTSWVPVFIFDYFKYQGMDVSIDISYIPRTSPTPMSAPRPTATPLIFSTPTPTVPPLAGPPTLSGPRDDSIWPQSTDITLVWNSLSNAKEYQVVVWGDSYNTYTACFWQAETSCYIGQMLKGKIYWRVQARDGQGHATDWSDTWSFTISGN